MKTKIIIALILLAAIMLFSMQLCSIFSGNAPIINVLSPFNNQAISQTALTVSGTISDSDNDQARVKAWIEGKNISAEDTDVKDGNFSISLNLSSLSSQTLYINVQGYDYKGNSSSIKSISIIYTNPSQQSDPYAPTLTVTSPIDEQIVKENKINITGTVTSPTKNIKQVVAHLEDGTMATQDFNSGNETENFNIELNLTTLTTSKTVKGKITIYAVDWAGKYSVPVTRYIQYFPGYDKEWIKNSKFNNYVDSYSGYYLSQDDLSNYLNDSGDGDYLTSWEFFINSFTNWPQINLDGTKVNFQMLTLGNTTSTDLSLGMIQRNIGVMVINETKLYIKFKIKTFEPISGIYSYWPLMIYIKPANSDHKLIAAYTITNSTAYQTNDKNFANNLNSNNTYEFNFYLMQDAGLNYLDEITDIEIFVCGAKVDVEIYEIFLYEYK